jgi:4-alpha-glucanotransferase
MTLFPRSSGVLLHPTSLPSHYGMGDLGANAYRFVDWLRDHGQSVWQVLPLGPTSYGDSPYQCLSAFAGNTNLISFDRLIEAGWLSVEDFDDLPNFPTYEVDYGWVIAYHNEKLTLTYQRWEARATDAQRAELAAWKADNAHWLKDWALYIAIKNDHGGKQWTLWERGLALREPEALSQASEKLAGEIAKHEFLQWVFYSQWSDLRRYANENGVRLIGDLPIFVAHDSSDVWANREQYYLEADGNPSVIAGVPPDYFSATGQRWGNPLYRWDVMAQDGYAWWVERVKASLALTDLIRIDHFRGFEAYWEIPASEETAVNGKWVKGPGIHFFHVLQEKLGQLPIIAEDLGDISPEVIAIRDEVGLPGMKILQFAWSDPANPFLPHNYPVNCVAYTGTHDNNTTLAWWLDNEADDEVKQFVSTYIQGEVIEPVWTLIRLGMASVAHTFVIPMQDVLGYGGDTRMNVPGRQGGNWGWRMGVEAFDDPAKDRLAHLTWLYRRRSDQQDEVYGDVAKR